MRVKRYNDPTGREVYAEVDDYGYLTLTEEVWDMVMNEMGFKLVEDTFR